MAGKYMPLIVFICGIVIMLLVSAVYSKQFEGFVQTSSTLTTCKDVIMKKIKIENNDRFNETFKFDISTRLRSERPVCNPPTNITPTETISALKANLKCVPNMEPGANKDVPNCILPLSVIVNDFGTSVVQLVPNEATGFLHATLTFAGTERMENLPTNIPTTYGTDVKVILQKKGESYADNYENWGVILDVNPTDIQDLMKKLTTLYYYKNGTYFDTLQQIANVCNDLEAEIERLTKIRNSLQLEKVNETAERDRLQQLLDEALRELQAQTRIRDEALSRYRGARSRLDDVNGRIANLHERVRRMTGLRTQTYYGYWNGNPRFFTYATRIMEPDWGEWAPDQSYFFPNFHPGIYGMSGYGYYPYYGAPIDGNRFTMDTYRWAQASRTKASFMSRGYFRPDVTGTWTFMIANDDRAAVWLGDEAKDGWRNGRSPIVNNKIGTAVFTKYMVANTLYPMRIMHGNNRGPGHFHLYYKGPDSSRHNYQHSPAPGWGWSGYDADGAPLFLRSNFD